MAPQRPAPSKQRSLLNFVKKGPKETSNDKLVRIIQIELYISNINKQPMPPQSSAKDVSYNLIFL